MRYTLKESSRARHLRITVEHDGSVILTKPLKMPLAKAESFLRSREKWVEEAQRKAETRRRRAERRYGAAIQLPRLRRGTSAYRAAQQEARTRVTMVVEEHAAVGGYSYASISIRNQKTRWGSCSRRGALSFNYRLVYLTAEELSYLVAHELAHTEHPNHGQEFWKEVETHAPEYTKLRKALKRYRW